jgi:hypothetical protein
MHVSEQHAYVNGRVILKCSLKKWDIKMRTGLMWHGKESVIRPCECGNKPSNCIMGEELLGQLSDY